MMGVREYARHRGVSHVAVLNAIKNGKLPSASTFKDGETLIDSVKADAEWMKTGQETIKAPPPTPEQIEQDEADKVNADDALRTQKLFNKAKAQREIYRVKQAKLAYLKDAGELIEVETVQAGWVDVARIVRGKILGLPNKLKQTCPDLTAEQMGTLENIIREALEELSSGSE